MSTKSPTLPISLDAPLDELLDAARGEYEIEFTPVKIGDIQLEILQIADMDAFVERLVRELEPGTPLELPFWAKIWRTSFLLAFFVQRLDPKGKSLLEIGAGIGLCGLFAAAHGFETVISDIHPHALLFIQISILKNGLDDKAKAARVDFTAGRLGRTFDYVLGSEVLYKEDHYRPLTKFLLAHMAPEPGAQAVLAREYSRKAKKFFKLAERDFNIDENTIGFKAGDGPGDEKHLAVVERLTRKSHG